MRAVERGLCQRLARAAAVDRTVGARADDAVQRLAAKSEAFASTSDRTSGAHGQALIVPLIGACAGGGVLAGAAGSPEPLASAIDPVIVLLAA